jgi:hypothetical protein
MRSGPLAKQMVTSAIDALAHLITGSPYYFHADRRGGRRESRIESRSAGGRVTVRPLQSLTLLERTDQLLQGGQ